jgi:hypothetical protein
MNDHELDDQIRQLAQSYNEPPATPRDTMWSRIEGARAERTLVAISAGRRMHWLRMGAGIAAVLVVGIGIGRLSREVTGPAAPTLASATRPVTADSDARTAVDLTTSATDADREVSSRALVASSPEGTESTNPVRATREERLAALRDGRRGADRGLANYGVPRGVQGAVGDGSDMSAYRLAAVEHMARAEVLLTSFLADSRNSPTDARTAAQFAALSRDLLKTTRLLLATRTTEDAALTRLLEDLELVLMQISQYSSEGRRGDLDAINQSIDRRNVLPKLRSAIPAGASASSGL